MEATQLDLLSLITGLLGGLALFLFGMEQLAEALKAVAGAGMKSILSQLTTNRLTGVLTGALTTAIIQSSSVTTVLVVGFISADLMSMTQSIGVIMGANIGTTITAQIIAFKVTKFALPLVTVGIALLLFSKRTDLRHHGKGIMGLGLVFLGMSVMSDGMAPLRSFPPALEWMIRMEEPLWGILAGTAFTALVQSSSATTGVVIVMASQGLVSLPAGIALTLGANVGTCVTALLASIGRPREALRAAMVHVVFNTAGVLLWFSFIGMLAEWVTALSPSAPDLSGVARRAAETPRQIANAHTLFNVMNTAIFIGLATQIARLVQWLVPDRALEQEELVRAKYLDESLIDTPALALDRARMEILRMGEQVRQMLHAILPTLLGGSQNEVEGVAKMDDVVDLLHGHIVSYLGQVSQGALTEAQTDELIKLLSAANELENIGDIIETNLVNLGLQRIRQGVMVSPATREVLEEFHGSVTQAFDAALRAVTEQDCDSAEEVVAMKSKINRLADSAAMHEAKRLVAAEPKRLPAYTLEIDILENQKRIYYFCKRMARLLVPSALEGKAP